MDQLVGPALLGPHGPRNRQSWKLEAMLLDVIPVNESEIGVYIAQAVRDSVARWNIGLEERVVAVTTDSGANMKNAITTRLRLPWVH